MTVFWLVLGLALSGAAVAVLAFAWAVRSGQLDDTDTPARRILFDDEVRSYSVGEPRKACSPHALDRADCASPPGSAPL